MNLSSVLFRFVVCQISVCYKCVYEIHVYTLASAILNALREVCCEPAIRCLGFQPLFFLWLAFAGTV